MTRECAQFSFPQVLPVIRRAMCQAGLLAPGSLYLPTPSHLVNGESGYLRAFVPGYSGGTASDFNRLPY